MKKHSLIGADRTIGCLGIACPMPWFRLRYFENLRAYWNRPISPCDVILETYGLGGFDKLRVDASGTSYRWQVGTMTIEGQRFPMVHTCWSSSKERFRRMDWLRRHHPEPIVLLGDGPMFDDPGTEFAFITDVC